MALGIRGFLPSRPQRRERFNLTNPQYLLAQALQKGIATGPARGGMVEGLARLGQSFIAKQARDEAEEKFKQREAAYDTRVAARDAALQKALGQMQPREVPLPTTGAAPRYGMLSGDLPAAIQTLGGNQDLAEMAFELQGKELANRRSLAAGNLAHTRLLEVEKTKAGAKPPKTVRTKDGIYELNPASPTGLGRRLGDPPPPSSMVVNTGQDILSKTTDRLEASYSLARGTASNMETINRIAAALPEATTGPGSEAFNLWDKVGVTLRMSGQDAEQRLIQTRKVIQGLSKLTLAGRGKLKGQGTVTDTEQALLARAESGDIGDMTRQEIKTILDVAARVEKAKYNDHVDNFKRASNLKDFEPYKSLYAVKPFTPYIPPRFGGTSSGASAPVNQAVQDAVRKYGPGG
jgi:hypothetical protein